MGETDCGGNWVLLRWLDGITDLMDVNLSKLQELVTDKKSGVLQSIGLKESDTTEQLN